MEPATRSATPTVTKEERRDTGGEDDLIDIGIGDDVLIVDDTPANLVAIEAALEPLGRRLVKATTGVGALARLLEQDFALIVLDVAMPGMTGIETARLIRARERNRGTPIIFVTGMAWEDEAIDEAYEAGGFDFLVKPIRPEVLRAKVRVFLKLQERTRALRRQAEQLRASQARLYEHELVAQRNRFESELLDEKVERLTEGDRRQHEIAALIGNELINPLHTLRVAFDLLREHPNADRGERIYSLIEHWLGHVTRLVEGLIDVAQLAAGQLAITPEMVNLTELVRHALDECRAITHARKLAVRIEADPAGALVLGDPVRLLQALTTVIDHAVRSTQEGGELVIAAGLASGEVVLRVSYPGRGFGPSALPRIFEMCVVEDQDADAGRLRLGFSLARRLIELHDGSIRVSSSGVTQGATFEVRLPRPPQDVELTSLELGDVHQLPTVRMAALDHPADDADDDVA
ncbi:MAG: hybrid sensor histidine kinase/response regulator [Deltaproteobacteria bacterium]|nr:MAG: hybrid sensor histidine kinase/response regulator [Deltaproteobacteria bacterium]TMQ06256.1 MAG: hybrid sensor histidine kinase/response regulator [Deltaproteobacteria bacterium]